MDSQCAAGCSSVQGGISDGYNINHCHSNLSSKPVHLSWWMVTGSMVDHLAEKVIGIDILQRNVYHDHTFDEEVIELLMWWIIKELLWFNFESVRYRSRIEIMGNTMFLILLIGLSDLEIEKSSTLWFIGSPKLRTLGNKFLQYSNTFHSLFIKRKLSYVNFQSSLLNLTITNPIFNLNSRKVRSKSNINCLFWTINEQQRENLQRHSLISSSAHSTNRCVHHKINHLTPPSSFTFI